MRVLILGAGYGGLRVALEMERGLRKGYWKGQIIVVDQFPLHQLVTEMHQVAAGSVLSDFAAVPVNKILAGKRIVFRQAKVIGFDLAEQEVQTTQGPFHYDALVIGLGGEVDFFDAPTPRIPGLREHAVGVQTMQQANLAQTRIQEAVYRYVKQASETGAPLRILIGGGGLTGVEMAGQVADEAAQWCEEYGISPDKIDVVLIEALDWILPGLHPQIAEYAASVLKGKGVTIKAGTRISVVEKERVVLDTGEEIPLGVLVWAGGVRGPSILNESGLKLDAKGRVSVNGYLQAEGYEHVYAIGDCALVFHPETGMPCAPSARLAINEAVWLSRYLMKRWLFPFVPHTTGVVISLGHGAAVAVIGRLEFFGRIASFLKTLISIKYLYSIGGLRILISQWRMGLLGKI